MWSSPAPPGDVDARRLAAWILIPLAALLLGALVATRFVELEFIDFTRDVFSTARIPVYTGLVSNVGAFLWVAGVAICLFARLMAPADERRFLLVSAAITAILLVDDFFMIHEWIGPNFLGIPEVGFYLAYAMMAVAYVVAYRERILLGGAAGLVVATGVAYVGHVGLDLVESPPVPVWETFAEEGMKLLGVGCWVAYLVVAAAASVRVANASEDASGSPTGGR